MPKETYIHAKRDLYCKDACRCVSTPSTSPMSAFLWAEVRNVTDINACTHTHTHTHTHTARTRACIHTAGTGKEQSPFFSLWFVALGKHTSSIYKQYCQVIGFRV